MGIPTPCRAPLKRHDYDIDGNTTMQYDPEPDTDGNRNAWQCNATSAPATQPVCCYFSPLQGADYCPACQSSSPTGDWCGESQSNCLHCGGTYCQPTQSPTIPPPTGPVTCCEWSRTNTCEGCLPENVYDPVSHSQKRNNAPQTPTPLNSKHDFLRITMLHD